MISLPTLRTYTVSLSHRYGVDKEYLAFPSVTLNAASEAEAARLALLRFPACWTVEVDSVKRHEYAAW